MIQFLLKGIWNDKSRSVLPVIVVSIGAALTVLLFCWMRGVMGESVAMNANFTTGHLKVTTRAYAAEEELIPNDLAIIGADSLLHQLNSGYPEMDWVERIRFGGLIDFPDSAGETRAQGPVAGWALDLLSTESNEAARFNIAPAIVTGRPIQHQGEALISHDFAEKMKVKPGDAFTLFGTTMEGGMSFTNFTVAGTVSFGSAVLDRGSVIIDIKDAKRAFAMDNAIGEILGFFRTNRYNDDLATQQATSYNKKYVNETDEYAPVMRRLTDQGGMGEYMGYADRISSLMIFVFVLAMSVVLWNIGLLGGLRRYSEFGLRLALGEEKRHIYTTLIYEGLMIGVIGSMLGTALGLLLAWYLQEVGFDLGNTMQNTTLLMPTVVRAQISSTAFYIGFIPGLFSMVLGNALSGIGIYKRNTAQLFKELEV